MTDADYVANCKATIERLQTAHANASTAGDKRRITAMIKKYETAIANINTATNKD